MVSPSIRFTIRVIGEIRLIACTFANIAGKKRYPDTTTEINTMPNVSSLKLRDKMAQKKETAKNNSTIGNNTARIKRLLLITSMLVGSPFVYTVTILRIIKYQFAFPVSTLIHNAI